MFDVDSPQPGSQLPGRALGQRLQQIDREMGRLEAEPVATITEAERAGAHGEEGHSTVGGWCRALTKWSSGETAARLRVARLTRREPSVAEALASGSLASGSLGVAQSRELGRAAANRRCGTQLGVVLPVVLQHAAELSFEGFRLVVRRWEMLADADGTLRDRAATHVARSASLVESGDEFILRANCDRATGAALEEIFGRFTDAEWQADWNACRTEHGDDATPGKLERTDGQRRFDALAAIFLRAASTPPDGQQPEPLINLVIDTNDGTILDVGRRRRLFTGRARDAVLLASTRCTWPGCLRPSSRSQADHRTEQQHCGSTDIGNGDSCGARHNQYKSRARITVTRDEHGYPHHWRPDGTEIGHPDAVP